jgi:hypothetical protein
MTLTLIITILKLVSQIFSEFFSWKAQKAKENKAYTLEMKDFREIVTKSLNQLTQNARADSAQARDIEDQVDAELGNKPPSDT